MSRRWLVVTLVLVVATVAFLPAVRAPFFFDDYPGIVENPSIRTLWPLSTPLRPTANTPFSGRPVANLSLAVNDAINRSLDVGRGTTRETTGFHLTNLALHLANGLLLFGLIGGICRRRFSGARGNPAGWLPLAVTAIWLVHPIQTEAVNYLSQRTELLVSAFLLLTLYAWGRSAEASSGRATALWQLAALLACALGMGAKENMIVAPLLLVLYERAFVRYSWRETFSGRRALWFAAFGAVAATRIATLDTRFQSVGFGLGLSAWEYFYSQCWAIAHYLQLTLWPGSLTIDYGTAPVRDWRGVPGLMLLSVLAIGTLWSWVRANRWGWLGFAGAWFFLILAPSSSFVPITTEIAAERRFYLPVAAVIAAVLVGIAYLLKGSRLRMERASYVVAAAVVVLAAVTFQVSTKYNDPERMWREAAERRPDNPRALNNLAVIAYRQDPSRSDSAVALLRRALAVDSSNAESWFRLGQIAMNEKRVADADTYLRRALTIEPHHHDALAAYGRLLYLSGDAATAVTYLREAADPPTPQSLFDLAQAYIATGQAGEAIEALTTAARMDPPRPDIEAFLGALLIEAGRPAEAVGYLQSAARHEPSVASHAALLSIALAQAGRGREALQAAEAAMARGRGDAGVYLLAGRAMLVLNRQEALPVLSEAVRLAPNDPEALSLLGQARLATGDRTAAADAFQRALKAAPGYSPAVQGLATLRGKGR